MKAIPLTRGKVALVDDCDFEFLSQWKWYAAPFPAGLWYAQRNDPVSKKTIRMHRVITGASEGVKVDHINNDGLDNQRGNLRNCTQPDNCRNRKPSANSTTGYKGVSFAKREGKYSAHIGHKKKKIWIGYFSSAKEAALAYDEAAKRLHGKFAHLNFGNHPISAD
jgi:hypothetical protein